MNWTPDKLTSLATGYWQSAALIGAVELSLFDHLDRPRSADELAAKCGVVPALLVSLTDALVSMELLDKTGDTYAIAPGAVAVLSRSSPTCMVDALRYNADLYRQWGKLAEVVRTGEAAVPQAKQLGMDESMTRRFVYGMESKARAFVPAIAPMIDLGDAKTLLDVGSGPGTLSRALAERSPGLKVTLLDLPDVLNVAREICTRSAAHDRLTFHPANYRTDALPQPFDAVVYAGALHQETPASAERLVQRFFECLRPGGHVYIVDLMLDDSRTAPAFSALFQITMMLIQPAARVFSRAEIVDVLERTGFNSIVARQPESSPYRLVAAQKPE
jgi:N,N-dimethyltransferase/O-methyltransferase